MSATIELIAVQPFMRLADYRTSDAFVAKIAALTERVATARAGGTPRGTDTGLGDPSSRADTDSGPKPAADQRLHRPRQPASERLAWGGEVSRQRGDAPAANRASGMV